MHEGYINDTAFAPAGLVVNFSNSQEAMAMQILKIYCVQ